MLKYFRVVVFSVMDGPDQCLKNFFLGGVNSVFYDEFKKDYHLSYVILIMHFLDSDNSLETTA